MKVVSWNINSLRRRQDRLFEWLMKESPDVVCLQETKCSDDQFPEMALTAAGYRSVFHGQKSYNGVAIISRTDLLDRQASLCDEVNDPQARVIAATVSGIRIFSIYAPNGQAVGSEAFNYKLKWFDRLRSCVRQAIGLRDTLRIHHLEPGLFSWWDYRMLAFPKNRGLRIDEILASENMVVRCVAAGIDREMRKGKEPSDHAPVWAEFRL